MGSSAANSEPFECSRDALEGLLDHENPYVRLAAEVVFEERYGEVPE